MRHLILPLLLLTCSCFFVSGAGAEERGRYALEAPDGWGGETIKLPPGFAKEMTLKGVEHIRFAPGMMKAGSEMFFCYAFVFELDPMPKLTKEVLRVELLKYYQGLCAAVIRDETVDTSKFTLEMESVPPKPGDSRSHYNGKLDWIEPFATKKNQTLNMEIQTGMRNENTIVFVSVSPQKSDKAIWQELRKIRDGYFAK